MHLQSTPCGVHALSFFSGTKGTFGGINVMADCVYIFVSTECYGVHLENYTKHKNPSSVSLSLSEYF